MAKLSVVVLEYNSTDLVIEFLDSISDLDCESIVSSNSEFSDEQKNFLVTKYPDTNWVFNDRNLGFAQGMNRGIFVASGDYIYCANVDSRRIEGLKSAIDYMDENPDIGILGPWIENQQGEVQDSFRKFLTPFRLLKRILVRLFKFNKRYFFDYSLAGPVQIVDWVIGGSFIIRKACANKLVGFDSEYFLYCEDMDLSFRAWRAGYKVCWFPGWKVCYQGDRKSTSKVLPPSIYLWYHVCSYLNFMKKFGVFPSRHDRKLKQS